MLLLLNNLDQEKIIGRLKELEEQRSKVLNRQSFTLNPTTVYHEIAKHVEKEYGRSSKLPAPAWIDDGDDFVSDDILLELLFRCLDEYTIVEVTVYPIRLAGPNAERNDGLYLPLIVVETING